MIQEFVILSGPGSVRSGRRSKIFCWSCSDPRFIFLSGSGPMPGPGPNRSVRAQPVLVRGSLQEAQYDFNVFQWGPNMSAIIGNFVRAIRQEIIVT